MSNTPAPASIPTVVIERVPLGQRCDHTNDPIVDLPASWNLPPEWTHGHLFRGTPSPCRGKVRNVSRPARQSESIVAVVEWKAQQVECPRCHAKPRALCVREDGKPLPGGSHTERWQAGQNVQVRVKVK